MYNNTYFDHFNQYNQLNNPFVAAVTQLYLVQVYFPDSQTYRGLGMDMATLDTSYFCSQVLLLSFMGYIVHIAGTASMFLATAATLSAVSCYFIYTAVYNPQDMPRQASLRNSISPPTIVVVPSDIDVT